MVQDTSNWRSILIKTDGQKWVISADESNTSMLELLQICHQIINKFDISNK